jgi:hypothetical protein
MKAFAFKQTYYVSSEALFQTCTLRLILWGTILLMGRFSENWETICRDMV